MFGVTKLSTLEQRGAERILPGGDQNRGGVEDTRKRGTRWADIERVKGGKRERETVLVRLHSFQKQ